MTAVCVVARCCEEVWQHNAPSFRAPEVFKLKNPSEWIGIFQSRRFFGQVTGLLSSRELCKSCENQELWGKHFQLLHCLTVWNKRLGRPGILKWRMTHLMFTELQSNQSGDVIRDNLQTEIILQIKWKTICVKSVVTCQWALQKVQAKRDQFNCRRMIRRSARRSWTNVTIRAIDLTPKNFTADVRIRQKTTDLTQRWIHTLESKSLLSVWASFRRCRKKYASRAHNTTSKWS